jgi:hypothetical protein
LRKVNLSWRLESASDTDARSCVRFVVRVDL